MKKILYACSVPIIAVTLGFISPEIDLNHNVRKTQQKDTDKEKLESPKTRKGFRNFKNKIREKYGDNRRVAQFYVTSWFITSFSLDLDNNTLLRVKDVYAKAISDVGLVTKGDKFTSKEKKRALRKIHLTFDREIKRTLGTEKYKILKKMTEPSYHYRMIDKGET